MSSKNKLISFHQKPSIVLKVVSLSPKLIFLSSPFLFKTIIFALFLWQSSPYREAQVVEADYFEKH